MTTRKNSKKQTLTPASEVTINLDMNIVWEHLHTGFKNYINYTKNLELHKEDIPIFASDYKKTFKKSPNYVVIHPKNKHLIPYILKEFPDIGVGGASSVALWELRFCKD